MAWLCTGQGAQYVGMGQQLYATEPTFRRTLEECAALLRPELERPLLEVLYPPPGQASPLTRRETEILGWIAEGKTTREIAAILVVSPHTVRKHIEHILEKLDVRTRSAAVARATRFGTPRVSAAVADGVDQLVQ